MNKNLALVLALAALLFSSAWGDVSVAGRLYHEQSAQPGDSYTATILLKNNEKEPQEVKVYQNDYLFFPDGNTVYGDSGKDPRSNGAWVTLGVSRLTIPAEGLVNVNFRVDVPENSELKGSYWSALLIESVPKESPESGATDPGHVSVGVIQIMRYAYQVITNIGDTGAVALKFADAKLAKEEEKIVLNLDVVSTGERTARAVLYCELYDSSGKLQGKFEGGSHRLHPGTGRRYKVDLTGVPKGKYKALIVVDCGSDNVFGKNINLTL